MTKGELTFASLLTKAFRPGVYLGVVDPTDNLSTDTAGLFEVENSIKSPEGGRWTLGLSFITVSCKGPSGLTLNVTPVKSSSFSESESESRSDIVDAPEGVGVIPRSACCRAVTCGIECRAMRDLVSLSASETGLSGKATSVAVSSGLAGRAIAVGAENSGSVVETTSSFAATGLSGSGTASAGVIRICREELEPKVTIIFIEPDWLVGGFSTGLGGRGIASGRTLATGRSAGLADKATCPGRT